MLQIFRVVFSFTQFPHPHQQLVLFLLQLNFQYCNKNLELRMATEPNQSNILLQFLTKNLIPIKLDLIRFVLDNQAVTTNGPSRTFDRTLRRQRTSRL